MKPPFPLPLLCLLVALTNPTAAQAQRFWFFENRPYFDPLRAGVRDANLSAAVGWADRVDFLVKPRERRFVWDIDVGGEIPLFGWQSGSTAAGGIAEGDTGLGLWFPIDFHMIEDLYTDDSNPIINTDYRFGLMLKAQHGLDDASSLGIRVHVGHESTHLGDEFSIVASREFPETFERINVSWEFLDVAAQFETEPNRDWVSVRLGVTSTLPFGDSYYGTGPRDLTESPVGVVTPSTNWYDFYGGAEYERQRLLGGAWSGYGSAELRWRSVYDYHRVSSADAEERQLSVNLLFGVRHTGRSEQGTFSPFVRLYHGVNPHGQFRNQRDFTFFGGGIRLTH